MDVVLAVGIGALQLFGTALAAQNQPDARQLDALAVLLLGGGALALIARRRYPVAVFAFAFATTFTYELLDYPGGPIWGTLIVAFVTVQTTGHRLVGYVGIALGYTSVWWMPGPTPGVGEALAFAAWMLVLIAATEVVADPAGLRGRGRAGAAQRAAAGDRARPPRRARAQHLADQRPGQHRAAPARRASPSRRAPRWRRSSAPAARR